MEIVTTRQQRSDNALDRLSSMQQRAALLLANTELPHWPDAFRGIPNGLLRSAIFTATRRGKRKYFQREPIASVGGVNILRTGIRLDQSDLDVFGGVFHLMRGEKIGDEIAFNERKFLALIGRGGPSGRSIGKSDREWLRAAIARLQATSIEITQGAYSYSGQLLGECDRHDVAGWVVVKVNPKMRALFAREGWTQVDWSIRKSLAGHPLAQWLHGFYSTHAAPVPYKAETLHRLCGSESGENATIGQQQKALRGWMADSLVPALTLLENALGGAGQPFTWRIDAYNLVTVTRAPTASQSRYLARQAKKRTVPPTRQAAPCESHTLTEGGMESAYAGDRVCRQGKESALAGIEPEIKGMGSDLSTGKFAVGS